MITRSPKSGGVLLGDALAPQPGEVVQLGGQFALVIGALPALPALPTLPALPATPLLPANVSPAEPPLETLVLPPVLGWPPLETFELPPEPPCDSEVVSVGLLEEQPTRVMRRVVPSADRRRGDMRLGPTRASAAPR